MSGTTNLNAPLVTAGQNQKEVTINAAAARFDAALSETFDADLTSGNVTVTAEQGRACAMVRATNVATSGRTVTLPQVERVFLISSPVANSDDVDFLRGSATVTLQPGAAALVRTDGTTNGLVLLMLGSATGGGVAVEDGGTPVATATTLNFTGAGVVATDNGGGEVEVAIAGGGSGVDVEEGGTPVMTASVINFVSGATVTDAGGGVAEVAVSGGGGGTWTTVKKSADTARPSTTTIAADPDLVVALSSGQTYVIRGFIFAYSGANADIQIAITYGGTASLTLTNLIFESPSGTLSGSNQFSLMQETLYPSTTIFFSGTNTCMFRFNVVITTTSAATFAFEWAQSTSDLLATTVRKGSYIEVMEV
jgi:hypothetical protein